MMLNSLVSFNKRVRNGAKQSSLFQFVVVAKPQYIAHINIGHWGHEAKAQVSLLKIWAWTSHKFLTMCMFMCHHSASYLQYHVNN